MDVLERLNNIERHYEDIMAQLAAPETAADQERMTKLLKEEGSLTPLIHTFRKFRECADAAQETRQMLLSETDPEMKEMEKQELSRLTTQQESLERELKILLLPKDPNDERNVIMEIRAGTGGEEAALFAAQLFRMYSRFVERRGWKLEVVNAFPTQLGGMKEVEFMVKGKGAWSVLKYESGVHRVQRVPETESAGRIHTSAASVAVLPEAKEVDVHIDEKDIRIDVMRASGNGGQCVNTTDSAVRLTHYPTGIVIYSQTEKSQIQNREKAFALLRAKLYVLESQKAHDAQADARRSQIGSGDRSEKIRTYNFPQGRVTDHRIHLTLYRIDEIMDGDLDGLLDALMTADQAKKLEAQAAGQL